MNHRKLRWSFKFDSIPCHYGYFRDQHTTNHNGPTAARIMIGAEFGTPELSPVGSGILRLGVSTLTIAMRQLRSPDIKQ